jgi:hypothetical protein
VFLRSTADLNRRDPSFRTCFRTLTRMPHLAPLSLLIHGLLFGFWVTFGQDSEIRSRGDAGLHIESYSAQHMRSEIAQFAAVGVGPGARPCATGADPER